MSSAGQHGGPTGRQPDGKAPLIGYRHGWPGDGEGFRLWDLATANPSARSNHSTPTGKLYFMDQGRSVLVGTVGAERLQIFDRESGRPSAAALPRSDMVSNFWGNNDSTPSGTLCSPSDRAREASSNGRRRRTRGGRADGASFRSVADAV